MVDGVTIYDEKRGGVRRVAKVSGARFYYHVIAEKSFGLAAYEVTIVPFWSSIERVLHLPYEHDEERAIESARTGDEHCGTECELVGKRCYAVFPSSTLEIEEAILTEPNVTRCFGLNSLDFHSIGPMRGERFWELMERHLEGLLEHYQPVPKFARCECCAGKGAVKL